MPRSHQPFALLLAMGVVVFTATGCGDSAPTEVSSATSEFAVAEESASEGSTSEESASEDGAPDAAADSAHGAGHSDTPKPPVSPDPATPSSPVKPPSQPPASPAAALANAPDGPPEKIKEYLDNLMSQMEQAVRGAQSEADARQRVAPYVAAQIKAAEKLLAADVPEDLRSYGAETKMQGLNIQVSLHMVDDDSALRAFVATLVNDKSPKSSRLGKLMSFRFAIEDVNSGKNENAASLVTALEQLLAGDDRDEAVFMLGRQAATTLNSLGLPKESAQVMRKVGEAFQDTDLADDAKQLLESARLIQFDFSGKIESLLAGEENALENFKAASTQILAEHPGQMTARIMPQAAQYLEQSEQYAAAKHLIEETTKAFADHSDQEWLAELNATLERATKRVGLIGTKLDIQGTVHGGGAFDWDSYRGKFVLVDFWASWCGPCREEFPNIKANYEKYRDMGFEVVGVNMDQQMDEVDQYLAAEPLPWKTVMCADPEAEEYVNPVAKHSGVEGIPFVILLDREGKVLALHVRGPKIEEKIREVLGLDAEEEKAEAEEKKPEEKKPAEEKAEEAK